MAAAFGRVRLHIIQDVRGNISVERWHCHLHAAFSDFPLTVTYVLELEVAPYSHRRKQFKTWQVIPTVLINDCKWRRVK